VECEKKRLDFWVKFLGSQSYQILLEHCRDIIIRKIFFLTI
jgi:hypothetical protein